MSLNGEYQFTLDQVAQNRAAARREAAKARQAKSDALTPQQRLANLDRVLGVGQGAKKERAKLAARIAGHPQKPGAMAMKLATKPLPPPPPPGMAPLNTKRLSLSSKDKRAGKAVTAVVATTIAAIKA